MTMGTHMSRMAEEKKFGDIFTTSGGIEHGRNSDRVVSLGHWASLVVSLEIRHDIYHYCSMPSPAPVVRSRPPPLCARRGTAVCRCEHAEQTRGIRRGLYVERRTAVSKQVAHRKKYFLLMLYRRWGPRVCQHSYIF